MNHAVKIATSCVSMMTNRCAGQVVDCFELEKKLVHSWHESDLCLNGAQCFQDRPDCPSQMMCTCPKCDYSTRCQLTNILFDYTLGYHISPHVSFARQSITVRLSDQYDVYNRQCRWTSFVADD